MSQPFEKQSQSTDPHQENIAELRRLEEARAMIAQNAKRIAILGEWPTHIKEESLLERVPQSGQQDAPGFDAGVASALNLIPLDKQELSARLHAAYTKHAVEQVREEIRHMNPDSQTVWWLAACSICKEGDVDTTTFLAQIEDFKKLITDEVARVQAAREELDKMTHSFILEDGVPFGKKDGCIQGAYVAGYSFGSIYAAHYGLYFIGTYEDSLGLENFPWSDEKDEKGRTKSGPVFGSQQHVKCASEDEWRRAIAVVKQHLPLFKKS